MTVRDIITRLRTGIQDLDADTRIFKKELWQRFYSIYLQQANTLQKQGNSRELNAMYSPIEVKMEKKSLLQDLVPNINCRNDQLIYSSVKPLPPIASGAFGPYLSSVTTPLGNVSLSIVSEQDFLNKTQRPFSRGGNNKAYISKENYLRTNLEYSTYYLNGTLEEPTNITCGSALDIELNMSETALNAAILGTLNELIPNRQIPYDFRPNKNRT